jgi:hypothetical protein
MPSQYAQTYRSRRCPASLATRFIGLPQSGHGLRIGWSTSVI